MMEAQAQYSPLTITPGAGAPFQVLAASGSGSGLFNPEKYSIDSGNSMAETAIPGLAAPIIQFVRGEARVLSMELFFDTYEKRIDVRDHTQKIYDLLAIDHEKHAPPICTVSWGHGLSFRAVLEKVSGQFTLFLPNGTPVRAILNVTFKEYTDVKRLVQERPNESADFRKTHTVCAGDTLSILASEEYGDAGKWRHIAEANGIDNPRFLEPGRRLVIPELE